jgi:vancomycin permeability regulator SanA
VIFGAAVLSGGRPSETMRRRVAAAAAFAARFEDPLFVPTGGVGRFGPAEAVVMQELLTASGVPMRSIMLEPTGTDTLSSVRAVADLLQRHRISAPVFAASSLYHLPRCILLLRLLGIPARAAVPPAVPADHTWWRRGYWWLRELPALPYDVALALLVRRWQR